MTLTEALRCVTSTDFFLPALLRKLTTHTLPWFIASNRNSEDPFKKQTKNNLFAGMFTMTCGRTVVRKCAMITHSISALGQQLISRKRLCRSLSGEPVFLQIFLEAIVVWFVVFVWLFQTSQKQLETMGLNVDQELFEAFAFYAAVVLVKMLFMAFLTAR